MVDFSTTTISDPRSAVSSRASRSIDPTPSSPSAHELQQLITAAEVPPDVRETVTEALTGIRGESDSEIGFAVRSSAFGEDTADTSFAGLYDSQLNIHPDNLLEAYVETAASKYTPQAMVYRRQHGLRDEDTEMAVGCMTMIDAVGGRGRLQLGPAGRNGSSNPNQRRHRSAQDRRRRSIRCRPLHRRPGRP